MAIGTVPTGNLSPLICPVGNNAILDASGSLIAAVELPGIDPDALMPEDQKRLAAISASIYATVPNCIAVQQYLVHAENCGVLLRERPNSPVNDRLSAARQESLNSRKLAQTRLVHVLVYEDPQKGKGGLIASLLRLGPMALVDKEAREDLFSKFSDARSLVIREREISARLRELSRALEDVRAKWEMAMGSAYIMPIDQFWTFAKFLGTMNTRYLRFGNYLEAPNDDMDAVMADGDISTVSYHGVDMLKLDGLIPHYFISMGLVKTPTNPIGMWSKGRKHAPATQRGNYIINVNFSPLSELSRQLIFQNARNSLDRQKIDIRAILKGAPTSETEAKANESYEIKMKQKELEKAATYEDRYGRLSGQVVIFGEDPEQVIKDAEVMTTAIEGTQGRMVWESIGLPNALKTLQVGGYNSSDRTSIGTESRFGAMSLYAAPAIGMPVVEDLGNEEAQYVFETRDGNPFYYSSFSGGKAFTFGVGPTGSGKTFFKNTLTSHFLKYGGYVRSLDIDAGSEPIAHVFGDDGGIIRLGTSDHGEIRGIDPFVSYTGPHDTAFTSHIIDLCRLLLEANDTPENRVMTSREQRDLDDAIMATLEIGNPSLRSFRYMLAHLPNDLKEKFQRWMGGGVYDGIFNARHDGLGDSRKRIGIINLHKFKETQRVIKPVLMDLFYRVTTLFEDPALRHVPKQLDVDESHLPLSVPGFSERLISKARTWRKHLSGITMWTQGAQDYRSIPDWDVLRGAATQFVFLADPKMDEELYMDTFKISPGVVNMIRHLQARKEAVIVQPDLDVAKVVRLITEPEQYIINTSHPREAAERDALMKEYGPEEGLRRATALHLARIRAKEKEEV